MIASPRRLVPLIVGLTIGLAPATALARDFIVVASTDPAIARGQGFDAGARAPLAPGRTLTLMHASGDIVRLTGAPGGVVLPKRIADQADADRLAILKVMVAPRGRQTMDATRTRAGICPNVDDVTTLDAIVQVQSAGCIDVAGKALEAWLAARLALQP